MICIPLQQFKNTCWALFISGMIVVVPVIFPFCLNGKMMQYRARLLIIAGIISFITGTCLGETYFVSTDGKDTNSGSSPETSWRTITFAASKASICPLVSVHFDAAFFLN